MTVDAPKSLIETLKGATKEQWHKLASGVSERLDSWQNPVTGFGTTIDKTTYSQFVGSIPLTDQALSNLYHGDDLAARMVDVVPDEMLREGFSLDLDDPELSAQVSEHLEGLRIDNALADGWRWGRLYGGAALLLGADDGRPASSPLVPERAKELSYLYVLDRRYLWPLTYYTDRGNPKLGRPETYMVSTVSAYDQAQGFAVVHESRLVLFGGATTGIREREQNNSWDLSVLHRTVEVLRSFNTGWKAVEILLTDANQAVFKMQGMAEMISAEGQEAFKRRMQLVDMCRSVMRAMVVDGGGKVGARDVPAEEFLRHQVSFDSIPQTLDKFMLRLSAAVQIPVTILMGQSPAGMNATGDSDFRWFYDRIKSEQTRKLAPIIRRIVKVALASKQFSRADAPVTVKFPPLWTEAPLVAAQTRAAIMGADAAGVAAGIWLPEEVALQRGSPDGYERDLSLDDNARKVREAVVKAEYVTLTPDTSKKTDVPDIELAPTDAAQVIKVNEARASMKLPPLDGPDGELTLAEFAAKTEPAAPAPSFGGKPAFPAKPPGAGAPPPLASDEPKLDADDYERDEAGRFAGSGGESGTSGRSERAAVAHERHAAAVTAHAEAKTEHESHLTQVHAAAAKFEQAPHDIREAGAKAAELAADAKERFAQQKVAAKAYEKASKEHEKAGEALEKRQESEQNAHDDAGEKLSERHLAEQDAQDARHESETAAHEKAGEALEAKQDRELTAATDDDTVTADQHTELIARHKEETERHEKLGAIKDARHEREANELTAKHEAEEQAHAAAGDALTARHEAEQVAHESAEPSDPGEPDDDLKGWASDLNKIAKRSEKDAKNAEATHSALKAGDQARAERLADKDPAADYDMIDTYLTDVQGEPSGTKWEEKARSGVISARDSLAELPDADDLKASERRVERRARAVRVHEREVSRLSKAS